MERGGAMTVWIINYICRYYLPIGYACVFTTCR